MFVSSPNNTGDTAEMPGATRTLFNNEQLHSAGRERSLAHSKAGASLSVAVSTSVRRRATTHLKQMEDLQSCTSERFTCVERKA